MIARRGRIIDSALFILPVKSSQAQNSVTV